MAGDRTVQERMDFLIYLIIYAIPVVSLWAIVHYGPVKSRWWRHETPLGVALFVGAITFLLGFIGPMVVFPEATMGPLFGVYYGGPVGTLLGLLWGIERARRRRRARPAADLTSANHQRHQ